MTEKLMKRNLTYQIHIYIYINISMQNSDTIERLILSNLMLMEEQEVLPYCINLRVQKDPNLRSNSSGSNSWCKHNFIVEHMGKVIFIVFKISIEIWLTAIKWFSNRNTFDDLFIGIRFYDKCQYVSNSIIIISESLKSFSLIQKLHCIRT